MFLEVFATGPFQANCVVLGDRASSELAIIDPGADAERVLDVVRRSGLGAKMILHTHGHVDHVGATATVHELLGGRIPVGLHRADLALYRNARAQAMAFGVSASTPPEPDLWLEHGQSLELGALRLEVRHTPGHSPGGVVFVVHGAPGPLVVVGDVLFAGSIGRTDLPGGQMAQLERSIRGQLYPLPDATRVITGHGPDTTIGAEKRTNPFVRA